VVQWIDAVRPKYHAIDQLRAIFPNAAMIAVTVTASVAAQKDITSLLNFSSQHRVIIGQSYHRNITYSVRKRTSNSEKGTAVEDSYTAVFVPFLT
jgi:superfamily II DNA helicase RecQ